MLHGLALVWMAALLTGCDDVTPPRAVDIGTCSSASGRRGMRAAGGLTAVLITPAGEYFATTVRGRRP